MAKHDQQNKYEKLKPLIQWWIQDRRVDLTYSHNRLGKGALIPEFDVVYWLDNRKIGAKALSQLIFDELMNQGHAYVLNQILSALNALTWNHYVTTQPYPEWLRHKGITELKRPRGRPRKILQITAETASAPETLNTVTPVIEVS